MANGNDSFGPWWLAWIVPILTAIGAIIVVIRKLLSQAVREDLQRILEEKHRENLERFRELKEQLDEASEDRRAIRVDVTKLSQDVAFLRGTSRYRNVER